MTMDLTLNFLPDGRRGFHKFFLKNRHIRIPENLQGQFRAHRDALGAADAFFQIIDRIIRFRDTGCFCRADFSTEAATGAFLLVQNRMIIGMHSLFLRAGSKSHGDIFDGSAEQRNHVSLEMGKDDKTLCLIKHISHLNGFEMFVARGN